VQFSVGFFFLVDAAAFSASSRNGSNVHVKFVDWIPGICSALGMLVINSIEKARLSADSFSYSGSGVAWKARFVLFLGFALLAGGLAGSVVSLIYLLLFFLPLLLESRVGLGLTSSFLDGHGAQICDQSLSAADVIFRNRKCRCQQPRYAQVRSPLISCLIRPWLCPPSDVSNIFFRDSSVVLWVSQNMEDDYTYNLAL
jgi:hypothetical protein